MSQRIQFSIREMLIVTAMAAVLLCVSQVVARNPWIKTLALVMLSLAVISAPMWVGFLIRSRGTYDPDGPLIPIRVLIPLGIVIGLSPAVFRRVAVEADNASDERTLAGLSFV